MQRVRIPFFFSPYGIPSVLGAESRVRGGGGTDAASLGYGLSEAHWTDPVFLAP